MAEQENIQKIVTYIMAGANGKQRLGLELEHLVYNSV